MNWDKDKSITLSMVCVVFFAVCLLAVDIFAWYIAGWFTANRFGREELGILLMASIYSGSVFGWVCLWSMWRLIAGIRRGQIFVDENVKHMRVISWCCVWAAVISFASGFYYLPFFFVAAAAGFMAVIVRIVKNAFQQAIAMKTELDLTI